ncbi:MAG: FTR1 family protein [Candidatus Micrarchaeia archaeon]
MGLSEFVVMFREVFEICIVVAIILACLYKAKKQEHAPLVYFGVALAIAASAAAAGAFEMLAGGFEENDALFEGATMVLAALLVTWLVLWMLSKKDFSGEIRRGVSRRLEKNEKIGLLAFSFLAVFREGVEIVLFLGGIALGTGGLDAVSALLGGAFAVALSYAVFRHMVKLELRSFFLATAVILVFLAAGMLSQGVHELQEAGVIPTAMEHVYDITPQVNADGTYPAMHEKGVVGAMLKSLVGYATSPSLEQAVAYFGYLAAACLAYAGMKRAP